MPDSNQPDRASPPPVGSSINDASAWILRAGVIASGVVMLAGILVSFVHGTVSLNRIQHATFNYDPRAIFSGIAAGRGQSIIEAGIYLLVLTPVMRVFTSMILFAFVEKDRVYALITLIVLVLTLTGLLWLG
jgi:uncharacterized membrane protein